MKNDDPFGDGGGARIGKPDTPDRDNVTSNDQGGDQGDDQGDGAKNGSGSEASRGIREDNDGGSPRRPGSEPLKDRGAEHESGYGGKGGTPRKSSDQR